MPACHEKSMPRKINAVFLGELGSSILTTSQFQQQSASKQSFLVAPALQKSSLNYVKDGASTSKISSQPIEDEQITLSKSNTSKKNGFSSITAFLELETSNLNVEKTSEKGVDGSAALPILTTKPLLKPLPVKWKKQNNQSGTVTDFLNAPKPRKDYSVHIKKNANLPLDRIEARNSELIKKSDNASKLMGKNDRKTVWMAPLKSPIVLIKANCKWVVSACENCELYVYSTRTGRLRATLRLESPVATLKLNGECCALMTSGAEFYSWNLNNSTRIVHRRLVNFLEQPDTKVVSLNVSNEGIPVLVLSNGDVLVYSLLLDSWLNMNIGQKFLVELLSSIQFIADIVPNGLVALIGTDFPRNTKVREMFDEQTAQNCEEAQLEVLIDGVKALNSSVEFRLLISIYLHKLISRGKREKLIEVLNFYRSESPSVRCGIDFETITTDIKPILKHYKIDIDSLLEHDAVKDPKLCFLD